jgi:hypothetical protein
LRIAAFDLALGFLIGVAWAVCAGGAYIAFTYAYPFGVHFAIGAAIAGLTPGFLLVVSLESVKLFSDILKEQKAQTALLEKLVEKISDH